MQLVRAEDGGGVDAPFPLREQERVKLRATDRAMAARLVFEVDLLVTDERAKHDDVARGLKRIQAG